MTGLGRHAAEPSGGGAGLFDFAVRGYDRRQVDERLTYLEAALVAAHDALDQAEQRNGDLDRQLRLALDRLRQAGGAGVRDDTFGFRVEKILRQAEEEARKVRGKATAAAAALIERARADAKATRDETERWCTEVLREADEELARLAALRRRIRDELAGVHAVVMTTLATDAGGAGAEAAGGGGAAVAGGVGPGTAGGVEVADTEVEGAGVDGGAGPAAGHGAEQNGAGVAARGAGAPGGGRDGHGDEGGVQPAWPPPRSGLTPQAETDRHRGGHSAAERMGDTMAVRRNARMAGRDAVEGAVEAPAVGRQQRLGPAETIGPTYGLQPGQLGAQPPAGPAPMHRSA